MILDTFCIKDTYHDTCITDTPNTASGEPKNTNKSQILYTTDESLPLYYFLNYFLIVSIKLLNVK